MDLKNNCMVYYMFNNSPILFERLFDEVYMTAEIYGRQIAKLEPIPPIARIIIKLKYEN